MMLRPIGQLFRRGEVDCHEVRELSSAYLGTERKQTLSGARPLEQVRSMHGICRYPVGDHRYPSQTTADYGPIDL